MRYMPDMRIYRCRRWGNDLRISSGDSSGYENAFQQAHNPEVGAIATAFFAPTMTTSFRPRVIAV